MFVFFDYSRRTASIIAHNFFNPSYINLCWGLVNHSYALCLWLVCILCSLCIHVINRLTESVVLTYVCPWTLNLLIAIVLLRLRVHYSVEIKRYKSPIRIRIYIFLYSWLWPGYVHELTLIEHVLGLFCL